MEVFEAIKKRRSIRRFLPKPVPEAILKKIIEAGTWAPSDCNMQGWNFVVVDDPSVKERLVKEAGTNNRIIKSPVTIVLCYEKYDPMTGIQSLSAAVQNMLLTATSLGIASCWLASCGDRKKIKKILNIPREMNIASVVVFGYPQYSVKDPPPRKPVDLVAHKNQYNRKYNISYSHDPQKWTEEELNNHHFYYCRKSPFGVQMDIVNNAEIDLLRKYIHSNYSNGAILDVLSYDGSYLQAFPPKSEIFSVELNEQTAKYSQAAGETHGVEVKSILFDLKRRKIGLKDNSVSLVTCFFKAERLPPVLLESLIKEAVRVLKPGGKILLAARTTNSFYSLLYKAIRMKFEDDIRKTGMYSFFGPYKPIKYGNIRGLLKSANLNPNRKRHFLIHPHVENIHQLYLQYKVSAGTCYTYRVKRENSVTKFLGWLLKKQGLNESLVGSTSIVIAEKRG